MAFLELACSCEATIQVELDTDNESLLLMWAQRFIDAHQQCGFMSPTKSDVPETYRKLSQDSDVMREERREKEL